MRLYCQKHKVQFKGTAAYLSNPTKLSFDQISKYLCNAKRRSSSSSGQAVMVE
ncbi:MAG: hypothetical protein U9Q80_00085 [Bacillota bacterium]|nr:hypothetical protein [Bacillota bacterium]